MRIVVYRMCITQSREGVAEDYFLHFEFGKMSSIFFCWEMFLAEEKKQPHFEPISPLRPNPLPIFFVIFEFSQTPPLKCIRSNLRFSKASWNAFMWGCVLCFPPGKTSARNNSRKYIWEEFLWFAAQIRVSMFMVQTCANLFTLHNPDQWTH